MAVPSLISFRDLNQQLNMHRVVSSPASDTPTPVFGRVYPTSATHAEIVIHNCWAFDQFSNNDWRLWYFLYAGDTWTVQQFDIVDGGLLVVLEVSTITTSGSGTSLDDLLTYDSDSDAAADGLAIGDFYIAGPGHDRADIGSITSRLE